MIEQTTAWKVGDDFFPTLEEAQRAEIQTLFANASTDQAYNPQTAADVVFDNKIALIGILTGTKPRKPRADRGKSHRKPQPPSEVKDSPEPGVLPGVKVESSSKYRNK